MGVQKNRLNETVILSTQNICKKVKKKKKHELENIYTFTLNFFLYLNLCQMSSALWNGSFEHPKYMLKSMDKKILHFYAEILFFLSKPASDVQYSMRRLF